MKLIPAIVFSLLVSPITSICHAYANSHSGFVVIVNSENSIDISDHDVIAEIRRMYLKQRSSWPDGGDAVFFARDRNSTEEIAFRSGILGMNDSELNDHWLRLKQMRGETPPRAVSSTRILLRQIENKPEAVSFISKKDLHLHAADTDGVRVLVEFSGENEHE